MKKHTKLTLLLLPLVPLSAIGIVEVAGAISRPTTPELEICKLPAPKVVQPEPAPAPAPPPTPAPAE